MSEKISPEDEAVARRIVCDSELSQLLDEIASALRTKGEAEYQRGVEDAAKVMDQRLDLPPGSLLITGVRKTYQAAIRALASGTNTSQAEKQDWCDHCSGDLAGTKHVLCEKCYRRFDSDEHDRAVAGLSEEEKALYPRHPNDPALKAASQSSEYQRGRDDQRREDAEIADAKQELYLAKARKAATDNSGDGVASYYDGKATAASEIEEDILARLGQGETANAG